VTLLKPASRFSGVRRAKCVMRSAPHAACQWEASEGSSFMLNGVSLLHDVNANGGGHLRASP